MVQSLGRLGWQEACGYGKRALVGTTMGRYKAIIGPRLRARDRRGQRIEAAVAVAVLNRMLRCWTPELRSHFNRGGISRSGAGVTSSSA